MLTDRLISTSKAARNGSVEGVHLRQLVIAQRANTALDTRQRTGGILLVEALRQCSAGVVTALPGCASADQIGDVTVHAVVAAVPTIAVRAPAEDDVLGLLSGRKAPVC